MGALVRVDERFAASRIQKSQDPGCPLAPPENGLESQTPLIRQGDFDRGRRQLFANRRTYGVQVPAPNEGDWQTQEVLRPTMGPARVNGNVPSATNGAVA